MLYVAVHYVICSVTFVLTFPGLRGVFKSSSSPRILFHNIITIRYFLLVAGVV